MEKLKLKIEKECRAKKVKWDLYCERLHKAEISVNGGSYERVTEADSTGFSLRVFKEGRVGFVFFTDKDQDVSLLVNRACEGAMIEGYENYEPLCEKIVPLAECVIKEESFEEKKKEVTTRITSLLTVLCLPV